MNVYVSTFPIGDDNKATCFKDTKSASKYIGFCTSDDDVKNIEHELIVNIINGVKGYKYKNQHIKIDNVNIPFKTKRRIKYEIK